jgi:cyanophycin synthetase
VLRLHAGEAIGVGEVVVAPGDAVAVWAELKRRASALVGTALPVRADPAPAISKVLGAETFGGPSGGIRRAVNLAAEVATLDLLMKATALPLAAGTRPADRLVSGHPEIRLPAAAPDSGSERMDARLPESTDCGILRLRTTGDAVLDAAWLRHLSDVERKAGRNRPLWLNCRGRLAEQDATKLVSDIAFWLVEGDRSPPRVLLEDPVAARDVASLCRLQRVADGVVGGAPATGRDRRLVVMARRNIGSKAQLRRLIGMGDTLGGVVLSVPVWGRWLSLQEAARAAKQADPSMLVVLAGPREGSEISRQASAALVQATSEIDLYVTELRAKWPGLVEAPLPGPPPDAGIFSALDIAELAAIADRCADIPRVATPGPEPRTYPEDLLPGEPLGIPRETVLEMEALCLGLRTRRYMGEVFTAESGTSEVTIGFRGPQSSDVAVAAATIATHKGLTRELLTARGLPVAPGVWLRENELDRAPDAAAELGFPLVAKPVGGMQGRGVTTGIRSLGQLRHAIERITASRYGSDGVVLERMVDGRDHRVLATPNSVISVVRRDPAAVTGDGRHTVGELVLAANVVRRHNPYLGKYPIKLDQEAIDLLDRQGLGLASVPAAGQLVSLREVANLSQGGLSYEVLESTHPSVLELGMAAVAAIPGLPYGGVDVFLEDHTRPVEEQQVTIIEINHNPAVLLHHYPLFGPPRNACSALVQQLATEHGLALEPRRDVLAVKVVVSGRVQGVGFRWWMARTAEQLCLDGWVANWGTKQVRAVIYGPAYRIGALLRMAYTGPGRSEPAMTVVEPTDTVPAAGFHILPASAEGMGGA